MNAKKRSGISRREFARRAAIASAASLVPSAALPSSPLLTEPLPQQSTELPPLTDASQAEANARYQTILNLYGSRFSDAQKTDLRRLCTLAQPALDRLRSFPLDNGDGPALYLKPLIEREVKHTMPWNTGKAASASSQATKKP
jgi:hypothetical protein